MLVIAGAALIAGAAVFFTAPSSSRTALTAAPLVGSGTYGAMLSTSW